MSQNGKSAVEAYRHTGNQRLYEYWRDLRAGRDAPFKAEVTATGLGRTLASNTFLLEDLGEGNLRFRLAGGRLFDLFGLEMRGMSALSIMNAESKAPLRRLIADALSGPCAAVFDAQALTSGGEALTLEFLLAPLRSDFGALDRVLGAVQVMDGPDEIELAPRRCDITAMRLIGNAGAGEAARPADAQPLPGFAAKREKFVFDGPQAPASSDERAPELKTIDGGGEKTTPAAGRLRLVKD